MGLKTTLPLYLLLSLLHNRVPYEHNNKLNAWVANNCVPFDMPFLSIIA